MKPESFQIMGTKLIEQFKTKSCDKEQTEDEVYYQRFAKYHYFHQA